MEPGKELSRNSRFGLLFAAWAAAVLGSAVPSPGMLTFPWLFPLGLFWFLIPRDWRLTNAQSYALMATGWILYAGLSLRLLLETRRARYFAGYGLLCGLLALNVTGCHLMVGSIRM